MCNADESNLTAGDKVRPKAIATTGKQVDFPVWCSSVVIELSEAI